MNQKFKFVIILALIGLCIYEITPPSEKLKPGIDLAGGTSLLYQIDTTGLTDYEKRSIAQDMIRILRQRIDPGSKRNLVWRSHGSDRIEIQMPLATQETRDKYKAYSDKLQALTRNNVDLRAVRLALIHPAGITPEQYRQDRDSRFQALADSSEQRQELLNALAAAHDAVQTGEDRLNNAYQVNNQVNSQLQKANIDKARVESLYNDWDNLDDPNRAVSIVQLAGVEAENQTAVRTYIESRKELTYAREALWNDQEGLQVKESQAWNNLEKVNFELGVFKIVLQGANRQTELAELKKNHPALASDIDDAVIMFNEYDKISGRLDDPEDLKRMLRGSGVLEFRIVPRVSEIPEPEAKIYRERLKEFGPIRAGDEKYVWKKIKNPEDFPAQSVITAEFAGVRYVLASNAPEETLLQSKGISKWRLKNAHKDTDRFGRWAIAFSFNEIGAGRFLELTKNNLKRLLCVLLDEEAISAPNIETAIHDRGQITGQYTSETAQDLVDKLNAGSLPARLSDQPISVNTVGPTMGHDNLVAGLRAAVYGLIAVAVFMLVYYWFAGSLANVALFMNLLLITGIMALTRATFTMPGIAGLILTIGMAVDANVLVFERIREEQQRGSSLRMAIKNGYGRALRTIMDANITTFVTALILWLLASEEVKGFALTLMIGIVSSMFTALFVTRTIFDFCIEKRLLKGNLRMLQIVKNAQVNWMKARPVFWLISILLVIGGWVIFTGRNENKNSKYSIEFTGGTSIYVTLNDEASQNADRQDIEDTVNQLLTQKARVQQIGQVNPDSTAGSQFEIVTTETNRLEVILTASENSGITAEQLGTAIRQAAGKLGDKRLADETTIVTPAPQMAGQFLMETRQTNRNRVNDALAIALGGLTKIEYRDFKEQGNGLAVTLTGEGTKIDTEEIVNIVKSAAQELRIGNMDQTTVTPADDGSLLLTTEQDNQKNLKRVLDKVLVSLSPVQIGQMQTKDIVSDAVREALKGQLNIVDDLLPENVTASPITAELLAQKPYLQGYEGGLLLKANFAAGKTQNLTQLKNRFSQSRFRNAFEKYGPAPFGDEPALFAPDNAQTEILNGIELAIVSQELIYGGAAEQEWADFVNNETSRFTDTLKLQSSFTRVTQIDPSVGGKSRNEALVAIVFSLLAIIIYIWVRFGNVRFGLAAVVALVHDVSIAMGMVAASYWISQTAIGRALMISDFKIDLPMIAGFLTVIGYSLNDTIVVFDRIRENRGKMALLSANVVNNSINQTISRTILTSVTTLIVLIVMYIWGGPGLRGFNYVLIIGVIVGTYSSIGIAAPLLYGARADTATRTQKDKNNGLKK